MTANKKIDVLKRINRFEFDTNVYLSEEKKKDGNETKFNDNENPS